MPRSHRSVQCIPVPRAAGRAAAPALLVAVAAAAAPCAAVLPPPTVTFSPVASDGFSTNTVNSVAINRNTLVTAGDYQFIAFYDAFQAQPGPDDQASVKLGRRALGTNAWSVFDTGIQPNNINDDHDNVAIAVDGTGRLHLSWGMHNNPINYLVSDAPVTGPTWDPLLAGGFTRPAFWTGTAAGNDSAVTYPEFYNVPGGGGGPGSGGGDLLFVYRQGGTGGGSGNGDQYFVRYDADTGAFEKNRVINGQATSVNAYLNNLVHDSTGDLHMSWTWRSTPQFQTNHNIMYATSPDGGLSWAKQGGAPFTLPITEAQGGVIAAIPEQSTLINQTSMALDGHDRPHVATWYAPGAAQGDHTRQYVLHWFDGQAWHASQITNRPTEAKQTDSTVRELARPIVLLDDDDRVLVVMRYKEVGNHIVVGVSEDRQTWEFITLSTANMGVWEPTYDASLWERENKLHLFFQPLGAGVGSGQVSVLEWDARAYFASIPEPTTATAAVLVTTLLLARRRRTGRGEEGIWPQMGHRWGTDGTEGELATDGAPMDTDEEKGKDV